MPDEVKPTVPGEPTPALVTAPAVTPAGDGVAATTPAQAPVDAEALKRYKESQAKLERDLRSMKSTFQSREAQQKRETEERERVLTAELEKARVSTMDDETRKTYEYERTRNQVQELERALADKDQQLQEVLMRQQALSHFRTIGVPESVLITDGTYEDLVNSGWGFVSEKMIEIQAAPKPPTAPPPPAPLPQAPLVDVGGTSLPSSIKPTWADMEAKYRPAVGANWREHVYQEFQAGRISQAAMPE